MPKIFTCGGPSRQTQFEYNGSVENGVEVIFESGNVEITNAFFEALINQFQGRIVPGGFSMTDPAPKGVGEWVANNSRDINSSVLTPRHASFICGILAHENYIKCTLQGNAVMMKFNK